MRFISRIFNTIAGEPAFNPSSPKEVPVPQGAWSVVVDKNGDLLEGRGPQAGDFLARPSMAYLDGGTEPVYVYNPRLSPEQNTLNFATHKVHAARNKEHLKKAVFLLSQTDDGRRLLDKAKSNGFKFVFDGPGCTARGANGVCDYQNKKVPLAEGRSAADVAMTLKHELQHMEDIGNGVSYGQQDAPRTAIGTSRVMEANARVSEGVAAAELLMGSPQGPKNQFRSQAFMNVLYRKNPPMAQATQRNLSYASKGDWGRFAQNVFPSFFRNRETLIAYDKDYIGNLAQDAPDVSAEQARLKTPHREDWRIVQGMQSRVEMAKRGAKTLFTHSERDVAGIAQNLSIKGRRFIANGQSGKFSLKNGIVTDIMPESVPLFDKMRANLASLLPNSGKEGLLDVPVSNMKHGRILARSPYSRDGMSQEAGFQPIVMPGQKRVGRNAMGDGNDKTVALWEGMDKKHMLGSTQTEKLNYGMQHFIHTTHRGNSRLAVNALLATGLKAPIGAFPEEYLDDLNNRLQIATHETKSSKPAISPEEAKLIGHWQDMAAKGMDPKWIDAKNQKSMATLGKHSHLNFCVNEVAKLVIDPRHMAPVQKQQYSRVAQR